MNKNRIFAVILSVILAFVLVFPTSAQILSGKDAFKLVTKTSARNITYNSASIEGTVNPAGLATTAWFEWGPSASGLIYKTSPQYLGKGSESVDFLVGLSNLSAEKVYFYRAVANNPNGTFYGSTESFKTIAAPKSKTTSSSPSSSGSAFSFFSSKNDSSGVSSPAVAVNLSSDKTKITKGEIFIVKIGYKNLGLADADNVVITVALPDGLSVDAAAPVCYTANKDSFTFNMGRVAKESGGALGLKIKADDSIDFGDILEIGALAEFSDTSGENKNKAVDTLQIEVGSAEEKSSAIGNAAAAVSGASPATVVLLTINLALLVFLFYYIHKTRNRISELTGQR